MDYKKENLKTMKKFSKYPYFQSCIETFNQYLERFTVNGLSEKQATRKVLNYLKDILRSSQNRVEEVINQRLESGKISDPSQTRKVVAGNNFQTLIAYSIIRNIQIGNIYKNIVVNARYKNHPLLDKYATITVGDNEDSQKPDSDVLIFKDDDFSPIVNFSCKTSLRERAGQTYKWKLLVDLATCTCKHIPTSHECPKNIYNLQYNNTRKIFMCFVTADLYNEINNPQINGIFNFFDRAYIAKPDNEFLNDNIQCFENVIDFLNEIY